MHRQHAEPAPDGDQRCFGTKHYAEHQGGQRCQEHTGQIDRPRWRARGEPICGLMPGRAGQVGDDEADLEVNKISISSPIARALIRKEAGDVVNVVTPGGDREVEIIAVQYI